MLHDSRGSTQIEQIDRAANRIGKLTSQIPKLERVRVARHQNGQVQVALRPRRALHLAAKSVDRHAIRQAGSQRFNNDAFWRQCRLESLR